MTFTFNCHHYNIYIRRVLNPQGMKKNRLCFSKKPANLEEVEMQQQTYLHDGKDEMYIVGELTLGDNHINDLVHT